MAPTAFITGASTGIGRDLARLLASQGSHVAIAARRVGLLHALVHEIERAGGHATAYELDVRDPVAVDACLRSADDALGGIDLVVANAGVGKEYWGGDLSWGACEDMIRVNVHGTVATLTALVPRMVARGHGHLVGVSSLAQYGGLPKNGTYAATKAFLSTFLESLRMDLRSVGISVTDVRPGFVRTPMTEHLEFPVPWAMTSEAAAQAIARGIEHRRPVVEFPWQMANLVKGISLLPPNLYDRALLKFRGDAPASPALPETSTHGE